MEVLRIATAGSVDDGKSTLIGRLLYETQSIPEDKLQAIATASQRKGIGFVDLSLLTDGLIAEREQGITIDVAHIYFSTPLRKYIIADSPGHVEYTRNMITGASKADVSVILVDVRHGITEQTHRHYYIANMLRIPKIIVCVNKMDMVDYGKDQFDRVVNEFRAFASKLETTHQQIDFIPVSALQGDNITTASPRMPWYQGQTLLDMLEGTDVHHQLQLLPARFPVQYVIRPRNEQHHDYRGYAGRIVSGSFAVGDKVVILPSGQNTEVKAIERFDETLISAQANQSVVITLKDNVDASRGDVMVKADEAPEQKKELKAQICWMDSQPLVNGKTYLLQQGTATSKARITAIDFVHKPDTLEKLAVAELNMNDLAQVTLKTARPLLYDRFEANRAHGNFILVDEFSNATAAVGFLV